MIEKAVITGIVGRLKSFRGACLRMECIVEERGVIPLIAMRGEFPTGVVDPFLIGGPEVDVEVVTEGEHTFAKLLPFENQGPNTTSALLKALLKQADALGQKNLEQLPVVGPIQRRGTKSLASQLGGSHALIERLNRLLDLSVEPSPPEISPIEEDLDDDEDPF